AQPRGLYIQGDGFVQSEHTTGTAIDPAHYAFITDKLGVVFRNHSYQGLSGNVNSCGDLLTTVALTPSAEVDAVANSCSWSNDVINRNPALSEASEGAFYENVGLEGPYVAAVVKNAVPLRNWVTLTSAYDIEHLFSRYCDSDLGRQTLTCYA